VLRARHDGWTPERQRRFLACLAAECTVAVAAAAVGMSARSAYKLRRHPAGAAFAAEWDAVMAIGPAPEIRGILDRAMATETVVVKRGFARGTITRPLNARALIRIMESVETKARKAEKRAIQGLL
jgi:hypothetical protein